MLNFQYNLLFYYIFSFNVIFILKRDSIMLLSDERINQIIKEEITKTEVESIVSNRISSGYDSRDFKKAVKDIAAEVIEDLFKTLWNRSNSWKGGITR